MPPAKRKAPSRRPVLDLKGEDSSSRSTWQTKYQHIQSGDGVHQNGDSAGNSSPIIRSSKTNPLSGLVGNYNSDSDGEGTPQTSRSTLDAKVEDFLKEIQSISSEPASGTESASNNLQSQSDSSYSGAPPTVVASKWQQCYDHNSGYPYYWNVETNEVTWEIPPEFKVITSGAVQQPPPEQQQQQPVAPHRQVQSQTIGILKKRKGVKEKPVCKYPWQADSDSEDEKIEMITSFGPQPREEESEEEKGQSKIMNSKAKKCVKGSVVGPQFLTGSVLPLHGKKPGDSEDTDAESVTDSSYETSSLLTHRVQDTGPPGVESFSDNSEVHSETQLKTNPPHSTHIEVPENCLKKDSGTISCGQVEKSQLVLDNCDKGFDEDRVKRTVEVPDLTTAKNSSVHDIADDVIAEIEKEMPPDYGSNLKTKSEQKTKDISPLDNQLTLSVKEPTKSSGISGIALLASYEDDSESEETSPNDKRKIPEPEVAKPVEVTEEKTVKPLFPCMESEIEKKEAPTVEKKTVDTEVSNIYGGDMSLEPVTMHKAFKRKKRIEFATTVFGPSTSTEAKPSSPEHYTYQSNQYNMDPTSNERRGFGFSSVPAAESNKKNAKASWIQFVKTETINYHPEGDFASKQKTENQTEAKQESAEEEVIPVEEIEDAASLLREKVTFLTEGRDEISPIHYVAIQLETLNMAWQEGALSKMYFFRWVKEKCSDLSRHEKSAAPPGWTCLWDRKSKRYFYRNVTTKCVQWDYPNVEEAAGKTSTGKSAKDVEPAEGGGDEMELCFTPPHASSSEDDKINVDQPVTPPPPVISNPTEMSTSAATLTVSDGDATKGSKSSKRKHEEFTSSEVVNDMKVQSNTAAPSLPENEKKEESPPLPPMPPPPPPPPDEPPPPLPASPPPLPLDPNQPLPPGVDEPEYTMFRRLSPKQSFKKSQTDTTAYTNDVMMTYGYAMNSPSVASLAMPIDYHGYVHDPSHYVVQSAPSTHIIHCPAKKSRISLTSELDSFYSDIAMLESRTTEPSKEKISDNVAAHEPISNSISPPQPVQITPSPAPVSTTLATQTTSKYADSSPANGPPMKKKKKTKLTPGLSMKKKGVSSLVAKWQQVQQEVRRDLNSDDDEDDPDTSTHK